MSGASHADVGDPDRDQGGGLSSRQRADAERAAQAGGGAALMGAGGVMAFGCSIGQGLTGFSTLALASLIAFAGILVGTAAGLRGALRVRPLAAA